MKENKSEIIIIIDIVIMGIITVFLFLCYKYFFLGLWKGYSNILGINIYYMLIFFYYIIIVCIFKIIFIIILIIKNKINPKIYLTNIPQIIISVIFILFAIIMLLREYDRRVYFMVHGIPLFFIGISSIIFQFFYINNCKSNYLKITSTFIIPVIYIILLYLWLGYTIGG